MKQTEGIHHITAIVGHPQENADFYASILGLRLVKKTVNFDDPGTYHLYFGNQDGEPGTIITFFPWANARKGVIGAGQTGMTAYSIPLGAATFWKKRLASYGIAVKTTEKFGETSLQFHDPHGLRLELVEREDGSNNKWTYNGITEDVAIKGFAGATLLSSFPTKTADLLENIMGFEKIDENTEMIRFRSSGELGNIIDIKKTIEKRGEMGVGIVHHIAFRAKDNVDQLDWQQQLRQKGYRVTEVRDRNYFNAIYFIEDGNILFEIATDPPGFSHDETPETMGEALQLPAQYESNRRELEQMLIPIDIREI